MRIRQRRENEEHEQKSDQQYKEEMIKKITNDQNGNRNNKKLGVFYLFVCLVVKGKQNFKGKVVFFSARG